MAYDKLYLCNFKNPFSRKVEQKGRKEGKTYAKIRLQVFSNEKTIYFYCWEMTIKRKLNKIFKKLFIPIHTWCIFYGFISPTEKQCLFLG